MHVSKLGPFRGCALSSPRYSGRADTESPSQQESVHDTPRKRTEKREHTTPYQPQDGGDGYCQQNMPQFGHPFYAPYQPYPYQAYAYPLEYRSTAFPEPTWHHTVAPLMQPHPQTQAGFSTPQAPPSCKGQAPMVPTAPPKRTKHNSRHPLVQATTLYSGPGGHDTEPFSPSTQSDMDVVPGDTVPGHSPSIISQSFHSDHSSASSDYDIPDAGGQGPSSQPSLEDFSSYTQLIMRMAKTLQIGAQIPQQE